MRTWLPVWTALVLGVGGCTPAEQPQVPIESPQQINFSSDTAIAYLSCMADHPPLVNPIAFVAMTAPDGEDYCFDESYGLRLYFNDEIFLNDPLGAWTFTGTEGFLSLEPADGTPRFKSRLDEFKHRETESEYCLLERIPFEEVSLNITQWDWNSFEATYDSTLENGDTMSGRLSGLWRTDIVDCD